ncbi:MAG: hypothetical protein M5R42_20445 [Rhodocyclaceae bacterium]|nr:hypothetical protein [Rhodocyclaceae bacterium]
MKTDQAVETGCRTRGRCRAAQADQNEIKRERENIPDELKPPPLLHGQRDS